MKKQKMKRGYSYRLFINGSPEASVWAASKDDAIREICHYAMMYSDEGKIEIKPRVREVPK